MGLELSRQHLCHLSFNLLRQTWVIMMTTASWWSLIKSIITYFKFTEFGSALFLTFSSHPGTPCFLTLLSYGAHAPAPPWQCTWPVVHLPLSWLNVVGLMPFMHLEMAFAGLYQNPLQNLLKHRLLGPIPEFPSPQYSSSPSMPPKCILPLTSHVSIQNDLTSQCLSNIRIITVMLSPGFMKIKLDNVKHLAPWLMNISFQ